MAHRNISLESITVGAINAGKIMLGNFYLDENKSFFGQVWEGISRRTWEFPQQAAGYFWSGIRNCWSDRVDYLSGATYVTNQSSGGGVSLGSFINYNYSGIITGSFDCFVRGNPGYMHEYGLSIDSKKYGPLYLPIVGLLSLKSASGDEYETSPEGFFRWLHNSYWTETSANRNASRYFGKHYGVSWTTDKKGNIDIHGIMREQTYMDAYPL